MTDRKALKARCQRAILAPVPSSVRNGSAAAGAAFREDARILSRFVLRGTGASDAMFAVLRIEGLQAAEREAEGAPLGEASAAALGLHTPPSNTGVNKVGVVGRGLSEDEKLVIEGGKVKVLTQARQVMAKDQGGVVVDYLRFTMQTHSLLKTKGIPDTTDDQSLARLMAMKFANLLGFELGVDRPGRDYYEFTTTVDNALGHEVGSVSAGGEGQRGTICFTLKGEGCTNASKGWERRVHAYFGEYMPKVTRIDLARDFYEGEVEIQDVVEHYELHSFSYRNRFPSYTQHGCWMDFEAGPVALPVTIEGRSPPVNKLKGHSRTFQIGKRESGKLFRAYEKGHQFKIMESKWLRCEVELRSVNRIIPWEALVRTGDYFAGAYLFCEWAANHPVAIKVPTSLKVGELGTQSTTNWVQRVVAPTLYHIAMSLDEGFDWLVNLLLHESNRRTPRALRGLNHQSITEGFKKSFERFVPESLNACAPAALIA